MSRRRRAGFKLVAAVLSTFLLGIGLTISLGAYVQGTKAVQRSRQRALAVAVAETELEQLRAEGYRALGTGHVRPVKADRLRGLPCGRGSVTVADAGSPTLKRLAVEVAWYDPTDPSASAATPQRVRVVSLISAYGMDP